jgi:hypothetical protein
VLLASGYPQRPGSAAHPTSDEPTPELEADDDPTTPDDEGTLDDTFVDDEE